jgi:hypothetical protein
MKVTHRFSTLPHWNIITGIDISLLVETVLGKCSYTSDSCGRLQSGSPLTEVLVPGICTKVLQRVFVKVLIIDMCACGPSLLSLLTLFCLDLTYVTPSWDVGNFYKNAKWSIGSEIRVKPKWSYVRNSSLRGYWCCHDLRVARSAVRGA